MLLRMKTLINKQVQAKVASKYAQIIKTNRCMSRQRRKEEEQKEHEEQVEHQEEKSNIKLPEYLAKPNKNMGTDRFKLHSNKSINLHDSSDSNVSSLSPHESSVDEEEMLKDVHKLLKNDVNLAKIAKKMRIDNLYKKYFSIKSDANVVEEEAIKFLRSVKTREQKLKRGTMLTTDKLIKINNVRPIQTVRTENARRLIKEQTERLKQRPENNSTQTTTTQIKSPELKQKSLSKTVTKKKIKILKPIEELKTLKPKEYKWTHIPQKIINPSLHEKFEKHQKELNKKRLPIRKSSDSFLIKQDKIAKERKKLHNQASDIIRKSNEKFETLNEYISENNVQEINNKVKEISAVLDEVRNSIQDNK